MLHSRIERPPLRPAMYAKSRPPIRPPIETPQQTPPMIAPPTALKMCLFHKIEVDPSGS